MGRAGGVAAGADGGFRGPEGRTCTAYELLGVAPEGCTAARARAAMRRRARAAHPDKGGAAGAFAELRRAYERVLGDLAAGADVRLATATAYAPEEGADDGALPGGDLAGRLPPGAAAALGARGGSNSATAGATSVGSGWRAEGDRAFRDGDMARALALYGEALAWLPNEAKIHSSVAACHIGLGRDPAAALASAERAAELLPFWAEAHFRCAQAHQLAGNPRGAERCVRRALGIDGGHAGARALLRALEAGTSHARRRFELAGHTDSVFMVRFEACKGPREGGRIATASHDSTVRIWCAASGALLAALAGHTDKVTTISWSADGGELISGSLDATAKLWATGPGEYRLKRTLSGHTGRVTEVELSGAPGRLAVTASADATARVWDCASGACLKVLDKHARIVTSVSVAPCRTLLATGSGDQAFGVWSTGGECLQLVNWECGAVNLCRFTPRGWGSSGGAALVTCHADLARNRSRVLVWDVEGECGWAGGVLAAPWKRFDGFDGKINAFDLAEPDGEMRLATACSDGCLRIFDVDLVACLATVEGSHAMANGYGSVQACAFSPDGKTLVSAGVDGALKAWETETGDPVATLRGPGPQLRSVAWSSDSRWVASSGHAREVQVWSLGAAPE